MKNLSNKTLGIVFAILIISGFIAIYFVENKGEIRDLKHLYIEHLISPEAQVDKGCLLCHNEMQGFAPMHQDIGCISCHKGDDHVRDKDSSHFGMVLIPGNFSDMGVNHPDSIVAGKG